MRKSPTTQKRFGAPATTVTLQPLACVIASAGMRYLKGAHRLLFFEAHNITNEMTRSFFWPHPKKRLIFSRKL